MGRPRILPDLGVLLRERDIEGLSLAQIALRHGVTKAAVSLSLKEAGHASGPVAPMGYEQVIPWEVARSHMPLDAAKRLRAHLRVQNGLPVDAEMRRRLTNWYARLRRDGIVLDYRPADSTPWIYVRREPQDGDLLIRWPSDQHMSAEQQAAFSFPAEV